MDPARAASTARYPAPPEPVTGDGGQGLVQAHDALDRLAPLAFQEHSRGGERFSRISEDLRLLASWITDYRDEAPSPAALLVDANCRRLATRALETLTRLARDEEAPRRLGAIKASLADLTRLRDASEALIGARKAARYDLQGRYLRLLEHLVAADKELGLLAASLRGRVDGRPFESALDEIQHALGRRARTAPLSRQLLELVDRLDAGLRSIAETLPGARLRLETLRREAPCGEGRSLEPLPAPPPVASYLAGLELLRQEISAERRGSLTSLAARRTSLQHLFVTSASEIRDLLFQVDQHLEGWFRAALRPLEAELRGHRRELERRARQLQKLHRANHRVSREIRALRLRYVATAREISSRHEIDRNIALIARAWSRRPWPPLLGHDGRGPAPPRKAGGRAPV